MARHNDSGVDTRFRRDTVTDLQTLFHPGYLVLDDRGEFLGVFDDPEDAALTAERSVGREGRALWLAHGLPEGTEFRQNDSPEEDSSALRMALEKSGLPRIDWGRAVRLSENLTKLKRAVDAVDSKYGFGVREKLDVRRHVTENVKMSKLPERLKGSIYAGAWGVALAPHGLSFVEAGEDWIEHRRRILTRREGAHSTFCFRATESCKAACLVATGNNVLLTSTELRDEKTFVESVNYLAKIRRSLILQEHPEEFLGIVIRGFQNLSEHKSDKIIFGRMNVLSDIPWELLCPELFSAFPNVRWYDYTKVPGRAKRDDYHLTFSWSDPRFLRTMSREMQRGFNLAVPFYHPDNTAASGKNKGFFRLPSSFLGHPVINGDEHDLRPLDRETPPAKGGTVPVIVGLRFKPPYVLETQRKVTRDRSQFGAFVVDVYETLDDSGNPIFVGSQVPSYTKHGEGWVLEKDSLEAAEKVRQRWERSVSDAISKKRRKRRDA